MHNRTRMIAAVAAGTVALGAVSTAAAVASTADGKPGAHSKTASPGGKGGGASDLAARLGVSPARLDHAIRAAKISLSKGNVKPTERQFEAALATILGIPLARVQQAFPAAMSGGSKAARAKAASSKAAASKAAGSKAATRAANHAFGVAVARELQVSTARVDMALRPMFAAGYADPSTPAFAAAARSLGVSVHQLSAALVHAKESLAARH